MKSLELFAGAGGLGMGLHSAGFHPLKVVEYDRYCCETLRENVERKVHHVKGWEIEEGDVREFDYSSYEDKVDLVSGGPPCQPFSMGGRHKAYRDERDMFPQAIRAVRETRPKAFVFENVKGLQRATFRNYFEYIKLQMEFPEITRKSREDWEEHLRRLERQKTHGGNFDGLRYNVVARLLNAADYGVPQKRERVFFVGFRDELDVEWAFPTPTHSLESLIWDQYKSGDYWDRHKVDRDRRVIDEGLKKRADRLDARPPKPAWKTVRDAIADLPRPGEDIEDAKILNHRFQPGARSYPGHTGSPWDLPGKTLKAGVHGVPGGENMLADDDGSVRYFTVRESARLQTFPDDFVFHGSWSETMRQLGNAVPKRLAEVVGRSVRHKLMFSL